MKALKKVVRGVTLAELWATALTFVIMVVCYFTNGRTLGWSPSTVAR